MSKNCPIIDAWAQPLRREAAEKIPEVARLFQQSGWAYWLNATLTPAQTVAFIRDELVHGLDRLVTDVYGSDLS